MGNEESKPNTVIAVEIGHVNSGFAYSLERGRGHIYTAINDCVLPMARVPTVLLLTKDGKLDSFGVSARDKYLSLSLQEQNNNYRFFNNLEVVTETVDGQSKEYIVKDSEGNFMPAEEIYEIAIKYLYKLAIENILNKKANAKTVRVVLTIQDCADNDMLDIIHAAAKRIGINEENLRIIFDGDATLLYCGEQELTVSSNLAASKIKSKYIVLNLGGRMTNILAGSDLCEDVKTGDFIPVGGESVTEQFMREIGLMKDKDEWVKFERTHIYDYACIKLNFERIKHKFDGTGRFILELPRSFCKLPVNKEEKQSHILEGIFNDVDNKIIITEEAMRNLFDPFIKVIVKVLKSVETTIRRGGEEITILLAGGFSESLYVRKFISKEMNHTKVLLVPDPSLHVLKGAVIAGYGQYQRSKYSYGVIVNQADFRPVIKNREMLENEKKYSIKQLKIINKDAKSPIIVSLVKTKKTDSNGIKDYSIVKKVQFQPPSFGWLTDNFDCELQVIVKENDFHLDLYDNNGEKFKYKT